MQVWHQIKLFYIGLLTGHRQPELAETFFNSVTIKILDRQYFRNDFIFVRPAVSTEYIDDDDDGDGFGTFRAYYPTRENLQTVLKQMVENYELQVPFEDLDRDIALVYESLIEQIGRVRLRTNFQIQVLSSLFFRKTREPTSLARWSTGFAVCPSRSPSFTTPRAASTSTQPCLVKTTCLRCSALHAPTSWFTCRCPRRMCSFFAR